MKGGGLLLLLFLLSGLFHYSRWALPEKEEFPAVFHLQPHLPIVAVINSRGNYGLYQISDGTRLEDVIKLTQEDSATKILSTGAGQQPVMGGELIKVRKSAGNYLQVERSWLPARQRMLLQIPLHPDRMTLHDWESLPGIGPKLAQAIEADRQKNGDFVELAALKRVKGIGSKKLEVWQDYFTEGRGFTENYKDR